jgi:hypothetical protein
LGPSTEENSRQEIQDLINRINKAWLSGRTTELNEYFHEDMVIKGPEFAELAKGRESCVKSYGDFVQKAAVRDFKASQPQVDLWEDFALATISWEISYEMQGAAHHDIGRDIYALTRDGGKWQVIWRAVLLSPQPQ